MTTKEALESATAQPSKNDVTAPVVLITGALTGIGRATAVAFAHEGARVVFSGRHDDEGQKLATELRKLGTEAEFLCTDVRHEEEVKKLVDTSKNRPVVLITGALTGIGCATAHQHRTHGFITRDLDELYAIKKRHEYPDRKH